VRAVMEAKRALENAGYELVEIDLPKGLDGWEVRSRAAYDLVGHTKAVHQ
jgi:rhodanese-related sulfurtransferase